MTDDALATLRGQLPENIPCYTSGDQGFFYDLIDDMSGLALDTKFEFPDFELDMASNDYSISDAKNVRTLYTAMRDLPPVVACDERVWSGLAHGYFWDYVQYRQEKQIAKGDEQNVGTAFFFTNGHKRSLYVNCLSRLWWAGHLTYDEENEADPFELTDLITKRAFPSTITLFSSSNMTANPQIALGVLDGIKKRELMGEEIKRKHFVGSLRYLNSMGGITVLDVLERSEIRTIVDEYLASEEFANLKLGKRKEEAPAEEGETAYVEEHEPENVMPLDSRPISITAAYDPIIDDLEYYGYEYVDKRSEGGALWVVGNEDLWGFVEEWRDRLVNFRFEEHGDDIVDGRPCWWTKDVSPE